MLKALEPVQKSLSAEEDKKPGSRDQAASLRFYTYVKKIERGAGKKFSRCHQSIKVADASEKGDTPSATPRPALADQWKVEKATVAFNRQSGEKGVDAEEAFALGPDTWSSLKTPPNGELTFYQVKTRGASDFDAVAIADQTRQAQFLLGAEAQRHLMRQVLQELKSKNAISLAYMKIPSEEMEAQNNEELE